MTASPNLAQHDTVRSAFPALQEVTYLNVGTYGIMPEPALASFLECLGEFERFGVASRGGLHHATQQARVDLATLLGCDPSEIAFSGNATDGTNLVLAGLPWQAGDEIITTDQENESIVHPLMYLQRTRGVRVQWIEVSPDPQTMIARCEQIASPRTRLLAFSHVSCETGTRLPAKEMCAWAANRGMLSHVDAAQSLGVFRFSTSELGCDFLTSNGHKWLSGPKGTGVFFARSDRVGQLSPAHVGAGTLERVDTATGTADPWLSCRRFEFGTRAHALYAGLGASLSWLSHLGWANIEQYIAGLSDYLKQRIAERAYLRLLTPNKWEESSGLTTFQVIDHPFGGISAALREQRIPVRAIPHYDAIRISTAHFNNRQDIDRLMSALDVIVRR